MALTLAEKYANSPIAEGVNGRSRAASSVAVNPPSPGALENLGLDQLRLEGLVPPGRNGPEDGAPSLNTGAFPSGAVTKRATA
jgi:hypothetical protein